MLIIKRSRWLHVSNGKDWRILRAQGSEYKSLDNNDNNNNNNNVHGKQAGLWQQKGVCMASVVWSKHRVYYKIEGKQKEASYSLITTTSITTVVIGRCAERGREGGNKEIKNRGRWVRERERRVTAIGETVAPKERGGIYGMGKRRKMTMACTGRRSSYGKEEKEEEIP